MGSGEIQGSSVAALDQSALLELVGTAATGPALSFGWTASNWLESNAETFGVEYLIWQGRIWPAA